VLLVAIRPWGWDDWLENVQLLRPRRRVLPLGRSSEWRVRRSVHCCCACLHQLLGPRRPPNSLATSTASCSHAVVFLWACLFVVEIQLCTHSTLSYLYISVRWYIRVHAHTRTTLLPQNHCNITSSRDRLWNRGNIRTHSSLQSLHRRSRC
jgi:hypothetical protein